MSVIFIQEAHESAHNSGRRPFPQIRMDIPVKKQKCSLESFRSVHFILIRTPKAYFSIHNIARPPYCG